MQACVSWVLIILESQHMEKKRPVWLVFPDYLSVSYVFELNYVMKLLLIQILDCVLMILLTIIRWHKVFRIAVLPKQIGIMVLCLTKCFSFVH